MKKQLFVFFTLIFSLSYALHAQDYKNETLLTIDGKEITAGEFERIYHKNNNENIAQRQSIDEYLDMFINFKLKVIEAENMGMDTTQSFLNEFNSYRKQLAKPYLADPEAVDSFARQAYERMKKEIHASHIMVRLDPKASPEDTLYAWEKAIEIRQRILNGEDFEMVARATSDDPSAKNNGGDLGWFTVFRMVLPFEDAAYSTPVGEVSMPVRTQYGYHIVKVHEVRPARGQVKTAHIYFRVPQSMSEEEAKAVKQRVDAVYDSLQNGADWNTMVKNNSDDKSTAGKGGELPWFSSGQMIKPFEDAAYEMENPGDIHKPVKSSYGWHIIKLLDKKSIGTFEEEKPSIVPQFGNGPRGYLRKEAFVAQLKKNYNYQFREGSLQEFYPYVDSSVFAGQWTRDKMPEELYDKVLFTTSGMKGTFGDFAYYLENNKVKADPMSIVTFVNDQYKKYVAQALIEYEDSQLEEKYPEFREILQEYHDGILLFDLTDKKVWSEAVKDSAGLKKFHENHKNEYMWDKRAEAYTVVVKDSSLMDKARELTLKKGKKRKFDQDYLLKKLCKNDTVPCVELQYGRYESGENEHVDATGWKEEQVGEVFMKEGDPAFIYILGVIDPEPKALEEARGPVTADYQEYLEKKWIDQLRDKYEVKVNQDVLQKVKENER